MKRAIQWVSITDEAVAELVHRKDEITKNYRWTYCCDEIFLISELIGTPLEKTITGTTDLRYIEWEWVSAQDSSPRVLTTSDIGQLESPDILFARKFNLPQSAELYQAVDDALAGNAEGLLNHKEVTA